MLTIIFVCSILGAAHLPDNMEWCTSRVSTVSILFSYAFTQLLTEIGLPLVFENEKQGDIRDEPEDNPTCIGFVMGMVEGFQSEKAKLRIPLEIVSYLLIIVALDHLGLC